MIHRTRPGRQLLLLLSILVAVMACQKQDTSEDDTEVPPPVTAAFESLFTVPTSSICGSDFISDLKIKNGNNIGSVTVSNDADYLYLTYELEDNWYLVDVQTYAGPKSLLPKEDGGNPDPSRFPGKQTLSPCDLKQAFTFRVARTSLTTETTEGCAARYFTAMRATVRHIPNANSCSTGKDEEAWAAPIVINPGRDGEWATAFYYCLQDCPPPPPAWCGYGQGYWFASGKKTWCGEAKVTFGTLVVPQQEGIDLWDRTGKRSTLEKAFFQAAALQLSMNCMNEGRPVPDAVKGAYETITAKLSTFTKIQDLNAQLSAEEDKVMQDALGAIGKWICAHNCNKENDPTDCSAY